MDIRVKTVEEKRKLRENSVKAWKLKDNDEQPLPITKIPALVSLATTNFLFMRLFIMVKKFFNVIDTGFILNK